MIRRKIKAIVAVSVLSLGLMAPGTAMWVTGAEADTEAERFLEVEAPELQPETAGAEEEASSEEVTEAGSEANEAEEAVPESEEETETEVEAEALPETYIETETAPDSEIDAEYQIDPDSEADADADDKPSLIEAQDTETEPSGLPEEEAAEEPEETKKGTQLRAAAQPAAADAAFAETIKETLMNREPTVSISYTTDGTVSEEEAAAIAVKLLRDVYNRNKPQGDMNNVLNHTGEPDEGDYLKWHTLASYKNMQLSDGSWAYKYVNEDNSDVIVIKNLVADENGTSFEIEYNFHYSSNAEQEDAVDKKTEELINTLALNDKSLTDYEKVFKIYDYIVKSVVYGGDGSLISHSAYAAMVNQEAVCQGYALMFYRLALAAGIDNRLISGDWEIHNNPHGWNLVRIGDKYYYVDATQDSDSENLYNYKYFLLGENRYGQDVSGHIEAAIYETEAFEKMYPLGENYVFLPEDPHTHICGWVSDGEEMHHSICYLCGIEGEPEAHTYGEPEIITYYVDEDSEYDEDEDMNDWDEDDEFSLVSAEGSTKSSLMEVTEAVYTCTTCGHMYYEEISEEVIDDPLPDDDEEEVTEEEEVIPGDVPLSPYPDDLTENDIEPVLLDQKESFEMPKSSSPALKAASNMPVETSDPTQTGSMMFLMLSTLGVMALCLPLMRKMRKQ